MPDTAVNISPPLSFVIISIITISLADTRCRPRASHCTMLIVDFSSFIHTAEL